MTNNHIRQENNIHVDKQKTELGKVNSINFKVSQVWNKLSSEIQKYTQKSSLTFTYQLKKCDIDNYSTICSDMPFCYVCKN